MLGLTAAEVAEQLGTTVAAVNSALQRARAALAGAGGPDVVHEPDDPGVRAVVQRYARAFEAADVPALVRLLAEDAILEMPPVALWYRGSTDYGRFLERIFRMRGTGWAVRELSANGQPAGGVRAGTRQRAPAAHPAGAHRHRRPGGAQRRLRRSGRLRRLQAAAAHSCRGFRAGAMSRVGGAGMYR
ncbi:nuclear transport factor 2 family protein [Streptomyces sp. NPDC101234]|uniref:nuclear transport factor 2 family protein n=1 Tax=Streptomyces sp. NPDC101234 TaxID=3366138 RepID=UPI0037F36F07